MADTMAPLYLEAKLAGKSVTSFILSGQDDFIKMAAKTYSQARIATFKRKLKDGRTIVSQQGGLGRLTIVPVGDNVVLKANLKMPAD